MTDPFRNKIQFSQTWEIRMSSSRKLPYFFNTETKTSSWDPPEELTEEEISKLPGNEFLSNAKTTSTVASGQVRASHLLIKHRGSRRPSSWKEENITRSQEEAETILRDLQKQINGDHTKFAELAKIHSDCSSHARKGDLGAFGKGQMQKAFEDATYKLKVGEMSDIVSTDSGVHLILRTE
ncbi:hypothetical protein Clacol_008059 [Clathrus columnatus]|uniref:Peptidyl-prolyl cis-trans isomerase n=1 Tax=Clathrus columnatus TaxID=1419009 RepID=A0AAV5AGM7_9AGAM|nr:hypothetical protein Clacol_008059 [Clathrus columnatus]